MKQFFALTFLIFAFISMTGCASPNKQAFCLHPLINGGNPFPLLESSRLNQYGDIKDEGVRITGAMCVEVDAPEQSQ